MEESCTRLLLEIQLAFHFRRHSLLMSKSLSTSGPKLLIRRCGLAAILLYSRRVAAYLPKSGGWMLDNTWSQLVQYSAVENSVDIRYTATDAPHYIPANLLMRFTRALILEATLVRCIL